MDALKVAFDTLVVGALALPWLGVLLRMHFPPSGDRRGDGYAALVSALPDHAKEAVLSVVILSLGYFLGAAVSRIADDFLGDADVWSLPTEASIRHAVYLHEYCHVDVNVVQATTLPKALQSQEGAVCGLHDQQREDDAITQFFRLQESRLLLQGDDKTSRFRALHDQNVILRGAVLNGLTLSTLCLFGFCASFTVGVRPWKRFVLSRAIAISLAIYGAYAVWMHFHVFVKDPDSFRDPPLAEGLMVLLGIGGFFAKARVESRSKYGNGFWLAGALTIVAYGAWWWTEVMYNQGILHTYPTL
jgi:hypothetical protein